MNRIIKSIPHIYKGCYYVYVRTLINNRAWNRDAALKEAGFNALLVFSFLTSGNFILLIGNTEVLYSFLVLSLINFYVFYFVCNYKVEYDLEKYKSTGSYLLALILPVGFFCNC